MLGSSKTLLVWLLALFLGACSHAGPVSRIATDYNRAMATTRDEQLLMNIVRASERSPLMFSAVGEVTGTTQDGLSLSTVATNLIAGGRDAITPTLGLNGSTSAVVKVTPLSSKEFTEGVLRPIKPEVLNYFMSQGWDREFLLPLALGGFKCRDGTERSLNGAEADEASKWGSDFRLWESTAPTSRPDVVLTVSDAEALEMMRSGIAGGYKVKAVTKAAPATSRVVLAPPEEKSWTADAPGLCPAIGGKSFLINSQSPSPEAVLRFRSPEAIFYYLGESFRPCFLGRENDCSITYSKPVSAEEEICLRDAGRTVTDHAYTRYLFRLHSGPQPPVTAAIVVRYNGAFFWVDRLDRCDMDRSLKTLSFLSELIALQTSASDLAVTPSVIAIGGR